MSSQVISIQFCTFSTDLPLSALPNLSGPWAGQPVRYGRASSDRFNILFSSAFALFCYSRFWARFPSFRISHLHTLLRFFALFRTKENGYSFGIRHFRTLSGKKGVPPQSWKGNELREEQYGLRVRYASLLLTSLNAAA